VRSNWASDSAWAAAFSHCTPAVVEHCPESCVQRVGNAVPLHELLRHRGKAEPPGHIPLCREYADKHGRDHDTRYQEEWQRKQPGSGGHPPTGSGVHRPILTVLRRVPAGQRLRRAGTGCRYMIRRTSHRRTDLLLGGRRHAPASCASVRRIAVPVSSTSPNERRLVRRGLPHLVD
jgi:hypothetical protein